MACVCATVADGLHSSDLKMETNTLGAQGFRPFPCWQTSSALLTPNLRSPDGFVLTVTDELSQVTRSSRYPLLIDPQGQALNWIRRHEKDRLPAAGVMSFTNDRLRDTLEYCMMEGKALIIAGVEEDIDPMLTPVLEKQVCRSV